MTSLNVQFSDSTESEVVAYFASPQDPEVYQNLGTVEASDARWAKFYGSAGGSGAGLPVPQQTATSTTSTA